MNSVISAFKTKKAASASSAGNADKQPHNNAAGSMLAAHPNSNCVAKKKPVSAQENGYQYLRHIREIETATKQLSSVVVVEDLLESDKLNFHATPPAAGVDVVDHAPALVATNTMELAASVAADVNMNDALKGNATATAKFSASTPSKQQHNSSNSALENGNCSAQLSPVNIDNCTTASSAVLPVNADITEPLMDDTSCSPIQHLLLSVDGNDDDDSENSTTACTSSSSEHSNSTVVHSPSRTNISQVPQLVKTLPPPKSPTLQQQQIPAADTISASSSSATTNTKGHITMSLPATSSATASSSSSSSVSSSASASASSTSVKDTSVCDTSIAVAVPATQKTNTSTPILPPLPIIKAVPITLPIIMPNGNSNLVSMPPHNATTTPINSAANTPKHARFSKPRLGLSRFMNHSMPSVHGRPNLTLPGCVSNPNDIASNTNTPKRISTHQRNLSLDFRSMGILLPPVSQVTNTRINLTQHHRNRSLDSALQRIPEVEVSSPNAESENTFCTPSILGSTMCSKIVTTAASVTAAFTTTTTPALTSSTTATPTEADADLATAADANSSACGTFDTASNTRATTVDAPAAGAAATLSPSTSLTIKSPTTPPSLTPTANLMQLPAAAAAVPAAPHKLKATTTCACARYRPKTTETPKAAATASGGGVIKSPTTTTTATTNCPNCQPPNKINANHHNAGSSVTAVVSSTGNNKKREDLTSLGSDDSGIICGSEADQISLNRIRHSHESLDSGGMDADEECIDMLETTSMDEEYNLLQSDLCFYQTAEPDCRTLRPARKKQGKEQKDNRSHAMDSESPDADAKAAAAADDDLTERRRYRDMNMSQAAINMERSRSASSSITLVPTTMDSALTPTCEAGATDTPTTPVPTPISAATTPTSLNSSTSAVITPTNAKGQNDVLFKNFFGATKNAIFRTAQSIIDNHEKKNASKIQRSEEAAAAAGTDQVKSPTDISKKKEFFGLITSHSSKKAAAAAAAAAASKQATSSVSDASVADPKSEKNIAVGIEKTPSLPLPAANASTTNNGNTLNVTNATSILTKSASITSLNKLKVPGVVKCFIKERSNIGDVTQQKTEKGPSGLLRFFESPVFNIHFAVHYLFYSKEPGVLSFIGNKIFSFPDQEVDLYIPQLIVMYIQMDELAEVLDPYLTIRCRKSVDFSLKCLWLLEAYNYQVDSLGNNNTVRKTNLALMKELFSKKERKVLNKLDDKQPPAPLATDAATLGIGMRPMMKKTHHRSQSDATVLLADSRASLSCVSISNRSYQQPPYTTQTLPLTPAKLCLGDLTSGRAFDNGCTCFESVRGQVNGLLGQKTVCACGAPKTAPQKEFMKALINVGKNLTLLPSKAEKTSALRMFLNLINKNLPARVWLPLYSDIPHHVVRITEEKTAVLNSKDKTPYIIYVEVVEVPDIYSSPLIQKLMPSLRHTKSEEHLEGVCLGQMHHLSCSRTSSCSSRGTSVGGNGASCRRKKDKPVSESSSLQSEQPPIAVAAVAGAGDGSSPQANIIGNALAGLHFTEDDVWSQEDDEITAQYMNLRKVCERDALSQLSLDSCDSRDQGMPVLFNIGDVRTRHCNNLSCENTKSFSNDPEDPSAAALKEPWHEKEKQIRESSPYGHLSTWRLMSAIVKCGDDLRQELMATQLLQMFKIIWQEENVDLWVRPYKIVCLSNDSGLIEPILNTVSLHQIKKNSNKSLRDYFVDEYGQADGASFRAAQKNFVQSCAAYCLISYLLQVKDRHNGNILLHSDGHIIHIDFGFILSISPKNLGFEQSPFKLTHEFVDVMGGTQSEHWNEFNRLLLIGMMSARKHMDRIINFVEIMRSNAQLPCFKNGCSGTVQNLRKRFHMNLTEQEMERKVEQLVQDSLKSLSTKLYDGYQYYTNGIL